MTAVKRGLLIWTLSKSNKVLHSGRLLDVPSYIRLGWKWLTVTNTLAYYCTEYNVPVKSFIVLVPGLLQQSTPFYPFVLSCI